VDTSDFSFVVGVRLFFINVLLTSFCRINISKYVTVLDERGVFRSAVSIVGLLNTTLLFIATIPGATIEDLHPSVMLTVSIYGVIFAAYYLLWLTIPKSE
jgi:hypothetical protein